MGSPLLSRNDRGPVTDRNRKYPRRNFGLDFFLLAHVLPAG